MRGRAAFALAAALIATVSLGVLPVASPAAGSKRTLRQVIPTRSDGSVGRDDALKAFAATIAPLPGVTPPKRGYPFIKSASGPIRWVLRSWSKLTKPQRAAVMKALPGIEVPGGARTAPARAKTAKFTVAELQLLAEQGRALLNTYLNPDLTIPVVVDTDAPWKEVNAGAYAQFNGSCRVAFNISANQPSTYVREAMLHELIHCYQFQLPGDWSVLPPWVIEGGAEWIAAAVARDPGWLGPNYVSPDIRSEWKTYLSNYTAPITQHAYSALGYYAQLAYTYSQDLAIKTLTSMFEKTSGGEGATRSSPAERARRRRGSWTPSHRRAPASTPLGEDWTTNGPNIPSVSDARYNPPSAAVGAGTLNLTAPAYGRRIVGLNPVKGAEIVRLVVKTPATAWGLLHHDDGDARLQDEEAYFCARKQCKCPDGRTIQPLGDDSYVALFAHRKPANVQLSAADVSEACAQSPSAMTVSGAFSMTVTRRGACSLSSSEMGTKPFDALFSGGGVLAATAERTRPGAGLRRRQRPGHVRLGHRQASARNGHARVTKFGEPAGNAWRDFDPVGQDPAVRKFGSVKVNSVSKDGASGTVDMLLLAEPPGSTSQVTLKGRWSCVPYDTFAPGAG